MTEPAQSSPKRQHVSVVPYALVVPVLVVMAQSAWAVHDSDFRHNALLADVFDPIILGGMAIVAVISYFAIRPFAGRAISRRAAFFACVLGFTVIAKVLLPEIAE